MVRVTGFCTLEAGTYYIDEKEDLKISAHLEFYPTVYYNYSLKYTDAKTLGLEDEQEEGVITYTWHNFCILTVPFQPN
jgi:hypothetical protein